MISLKASTSDRYYNGCVDTNKLINNDHQSPRTCNVVVSRRIDRSPKSNQTSNLWNPKLSYYSTLSDHHGNANTPQPQAFLAWSPWHKIQLIPIVPVSRVGGLDSNLYDWKTASSTPCKEFPGHNGYVSLPGDVMTVAVSPSNQNEFVSGACDTRTRIYDIRDPNPVITWSDADCDINSVCVSGNGTLYASAGDESICRVYDRRSTRAAAAFKHESVLCGTTSVAFSASGHSLFSTCDSGELIGWSVLTGRLAWRDTSATNRLTCVSLSPSGDTLFTSSWDNLVRVYTSNP
ncbi:guanine nucleotide-binding protein beta subunit [Pelomyxa schiedti]|nr:guanine nucleotide-binding protein beta subunit [Pelomyxa schiedti]